MSERKYVPRSGGRTAEQRSSTGSGARRYPARGYSRGDQPIQSYPTEGNAALKAELAEPLRGTGASQPREAQRERAVPPRLQVAPPAPITAPRAPFVAVIIAIVVAGLIGILLINTKTNENAFEISKLQDQKTALDNQQQDLENQIAGYESTGNLDAAARRLGLVKADTPAYIRLPDGLVIGIPKPGTGPASVTAQDPADATQDGDAQNGVTPDNTGQGKITGAGTAQSGTAQSGTAQNGTAQSGTAQNGTAQNGTVQGGPAQSGGTSGGTTQGGNAAHGTQQNGTQQNGTAGQGAGDQSAGPPGPDQIARADDLDHGAASPDFQ